MSRPTVYKKGAMTDAERQKRRRTRLKREAKKVEQTAIIAAKRETNRVKRTKAAINPIVQWRREAIAAQLQVTMLESRLRLYEQIPMHDASGAADELARQIAEYMQEKPGMTIDDVRAAIDRRFGVP